MDYVFYALIALIGYFLGALPFGYLVAKARGVDIFKEGSGNPGATNVRRVLGSRAGNLVFALDFLKGSLAAALPLLLAFATAHLVTPAPDLPASATTQFATAPGTLPPDEIAAFQKDAMAAAVNEALVAVLGALLGHSFSVFTRFKGGKGVATAAGGLVVLMPVPCGIGIAVWLLTYLTTRYVSLGSILAAVTVPLCGWLFDNPLPLKLVATGVGLFVIFRHRVNITRLLNGTENRFVKKGDAPPQPETKPPQAPQ